MVDLDSPLLKELCYLAHARNILNHNRSKLRWRISYYKKTYIKTGKTHKRMSLSEIKLMTLQLMRDLYESRAQIVKFTMNNGPRFRCLLKDLNLSPVYSNGYIIFLAMPNSNAVSYLSKQIIKEKGEQYLLEMEIEKMLR